MKIEHNEAKPKILRNTDLRNGEVYERVSNNEKSLFYIKTDEAFLVNLISGCKMRLDFFDCDKFIHHPNATLVL